MIEINNLHKTFNHGTINEVYALQEINVKIKEGEFVTIIGTNGSGKSTLLNAIAGNFIPDTGFIKIDGIDVTTKKDYSRAKYISRVFQNPYMGTAPDMTIAENLHLANLRGLGRYPRIGLSSEKISKYKERVKLLEMQLEERLDNIIG
ncbi:MAG: putative tryptophan/tyrosine transport system ATP-binding protein, partial [Bacteroidota bacterium]|nr:putative tryptophan/tyrosine transport system ATP-binding protein [Bacteroidota bacterium]